MIRSLKLKPSTARVETPALAPLLDIAGLERLLGCDERTIARMRSSGRFPKPDLVVGRRLPRWKASTLTEWIDRGGKV